MRLALSIEYIGKKYYGWQKQNSKSTNTVQHYVDSALSKIANHKINSICSGRTDTGVNALNQIIHFDTFSRRSDKNWIDGVNSNLPDDIRLKKIYHVDDNFHARFHAKSRTYKYFINTDSNSTIFNNAYTYVVNDKISISKMKSSLKYIHGIQDYSSFRSSGCQANTAIRNIISTSLIKNKNIITFTITANAFLYHMVRNIIGTLVDIGIGKIPPSQIKIILKHKDRKYCSKMAPPNGLFLWNVSYPRKYRIKYNSESVLL
jgi:tRNA pseudouridine38-40 synthase